MKARIVYRYLWSWIWTGVAMRIRQKWLRTASACGALWARRPWSPHSLWSVLWWAPWGQPRVCSLWADLRNGTSAIARRYLHYRRRADPADAALAVREAARAAEVARVKLDDARRAVAASDPLRTRREGFCTCVDGRYWPDCGIAMHRALARRGEAKIDQPHSMHEASLDQHQAAHSWDGGHLAWGTERLREHLEVWHSLTAPDAVDQELKHLHVRVHRAGYTPLQVVRDEMDDMTPPTTPRTAAEFEATVDDMRLALDDLELVIERGEIDSSDPIRSLAINLRLAVDRWTRDKEANR